MTTPREGRRYQALYRVGSKVQILHLRGVGIVWTLRLPTRYASFVGQGNARTERKNERKEEYQGDAIDV